MDLLMSHRPLLLTCLLLLSSVVTAAQETDQRGEAHEWKSKNSAYTVIDFAAAWCRPCWDVLPRLQSFSTDHPDIRVLVVSVDDKVAGRDALVTKLSLTVPVIWDENKKIAAHYRPEGMPSTVVLDPAGQVVYRHVGSGKKQWDEMVAFLQNVTKH